MVFLLLQSKYKMVNVYVHSVNMMKRLGITTSHTHYL